MTALELMQSMNGIDDDLVWEAKHAKRAVRPRRELLIAAIVAVLLLLVGCTAVYILDAGAMLETIFGINGRDDYTYEIVRGLYEPGGARTELDPKLAKKYIEPYIIPGEGTITDGDSRLTVLSYLVDRASCTAAFYLRLDNPPEYEEFNSGEILFSQEAGPQGWYINPHAVGQDATIGRSFIDKISTTEDALYCAMMLSCQPQCTELELRLGYGEDIIRIPLPETTDLPCLTLADGEVRLTPFGIKLPRALVKQDDPPDRFFNRHEVAIQFKDGSEYLLLNTGFENEADNYIGYTYGMALELTMEHYVYVFNRVVDIRQVAGLRINEHIYPV